MKIAYVFAYFGDGGAEDHAVLLAKKAKQTGHTPLFIIGEFSGSAQKRLVDNDLHFMELAMKSSFNPISVKKSIAGLKKIIQSENIEIVHTHMLREQSLAAMAKISGLKFVLIRTFHRFDQFNKKMKPLLPIYQKHTDAVIAISKGMMKYLQKNGVRQNVYLIENGVEKIEVNNHQPAMGFIGRLTEEKGILNFVKSNIDILKQVKLVIAGDGPDFGAIKEIVDDNRLNVEMLGRVSNKADFYQKISALVLPSSTEVLPLVVLEAYSCGLPVVAFDIESMKDLIDRENGELVELCNHKKLGQVASGMIEKYSEYNRLNTTKYESEYSDEIMWSKTLSLYKSLLG